MKGKIRILGVTAAVAFAVLCTASGFALAEVISDNSSSGSVTTAGFTLPVKASNLKVYSAIPAEKDDEGVFFDKKGDAYKYEQSLVQGDAGALAFPHGGSVAIDDKEKTVAVNGMLPGDKVEFRISVSSVSNISFNYRAELYIDSSKGENLANEIYVDAGELKSYRTDLGDFVPADGAEGDDFGAAVITDYTPWSTYSANQSSIEEVNVTITLPIDAHKGQDETVSFKYVARGVQNADAQPDVATIETEEGEKGFKTVQQAVDYAEEHAVKEISLVASTALEEGAITIGSPIAFKGVALEDGSAPVVKGARISVINGAAVSFENITFSGASYLDISDCMALTVKNCAAQITPVRFFDSASRTYLSDSAFIVSGASRTATVLTVTDNEFAYGDGAAVCLRSPLNDGSVISGNTLGAESSPYGGTAVLVLGGAQSGATVRVEKNELYGNLPLMLGVSENRVSFTLVSKDNVAGGAGNTFVSGKARAAFLDGGSTINGNALTCANVEESGLLFGAVDVALGALNKITAGKIALANISTAEFYQGYVYAGALAPNAIGLYRGGALYAYLNSTAEAPGYVITEI